MVAPIKRMISFSCLLKAAATEMVLLIRKEATAKRTPMITADRAPAILPALVSPAAAALE